MQLPLGTFYLANAKKGAPLWRQYLLEVMQNHYQTSPWISTSWVINYTFTEPWPSLISGKNVFEFTQGMLLKVAAMALWIPGMFQGKKEYGRFNHYLSYLFNLLFSYMLITV